MASAMLILIPPLKNFRRVHYMVSLTFLKWDEAIHKRKTWSILFKKTKIWVNVQDPILFQNKRLL